MERFIAPTAAALRAKGLAYMGVMYLGLMITKDGPKLVEYNCRFGDPECQVLMPRLKSDLLTVLLAMRDGMLKEVDLRWSDDVALTVAMASKGYPGAYEKGHVITRAGGGGEAAGRADLPRRDGEARQRFRRGRRPRAQRHRDRRERGRGAGARLCGRST